MQKTQGTVSKMPSSGSAEKLANMKSTNKLTKQPVQNYQMQNSKINGGGQSKEFLKNYFKLQGRVTFDELINTYGKTQEIKTKGGERLSSRKSSRDNLKTIKPDLNSHKKV